MANERHAPVIDILRRMGAKAAPAIPELTAWRATDKLDPKQAAAIDAALAGIRQSTASLRGSS